MCDGCRSIAPALRLVAALSAGAVLAARPVRGDRRPAAHVYTGPVTPGGRSTSTARPLCGTRTARLTVIAQPTDDPTRLTTDGRRFCRRCLHALPAALDPNGLKPLHAHLRAPRGAGWNTPPTVYGHLTPQALTAAGRWARTVEETHEIGRVLLEVHGPKPYAASRHALRGRPAALALWDAHQVVHKRRSRLANSAGTAEERAARAAARDAATANAIDVQARRRHEDRIDRLAAMHRRGTYLTPRERTELENARRAL